MTNLTNELVSLSLILVLPTVDCLIIYYHRRTSY